LADDELRGCLTRLFQVPRLLLDHRDIAQAEPGRDIYAVAEYVATALTIRES
jgi:hypothetical protein